MKQILLLMVLLTVSIRAYAQHVTVSADKMNIAYIGVSNPISVSADSVACDEIILKTDNGTIAGAGCDYNYMPGIPGNARIEVYTKRGNILKKIYEYPLRAKKVPPPTISVAGKTGGFISRTQLTRSPGPESIIPDFDYDFRYIITSFTITITRGADFNVLLQHTVNNNNGASFNDEIRAAFSHLRRNDRIEIGNIKVKDADGQLRTMKDMSLQIFN